MFTRCQSYKNNEKWTACLINNKNHFDLFAKMDFPRLKKWVLYIIVRLLSAFGAQIFAFFAYLTQYQLNHSAKKLVGIMKKHIWRNCSHTIMVKKGQKSCFHFCCQLNIWIKTKSVHQCFLKYEYIKHYSVQIFAQCD